MGTHLAGRVLPFEHQKQIIEGARRDTLDLEYMEAVLIAMLAERGRVLPTDFRLKLKEFDKRVLFHTNLDYSTAGFAPSTVIAAVAGAREKLFHAASRQAEVWVPQRLSSVVETRVNTLVQKALHDPAHIDRFQRVELRGRSFREAINSGERSVRDLINLLETPNAQRFKKWLGNLPPSAELITEYYRSVFGESPFVASLPFKVFRSTLFIGINTALGGLVDGTGTIGATASAVGGEVLSKGADYLERKLLDGWRPNQFVDAEARSFLKVTS
jgi:hypothetical protein